jgi:hypothetical protein
MRALGVGTTAAGILALWTTTALAEARVERVVVYRDGGWLACDVAATGLLDARVRSTVESGLPGSCVYRLVLSREGDGELARVLWATSLQLDLWSERFLLTDPREARQFDAWQSADSALAHPRGLRLVQLEGLPRDRALRVSVDVLVEPLGPAERARLARYVSESSAAGADEFAVDIGGLLGRFLGRKGGGAAAHAARGQSEAFVWTELPDIAAPGTPAPERGP